MSKITEYTKVNDYDPGDVLLIDGENGTRILPIEKVGIGCGLTVEDGKLCVLGDGEPQPVVLDETFTEKIHTLSGLINRQNAMLDLLTSDIRGELATDIATVANLCKNGEILDIMDYGDQISPAWTNGTNSYNPPMNLCHESDELLETGESIHGAYFEWDKLLPAEIPFDEPEAIYYCDGTEGTGDHYITIGLTYYGWTMGKHIHFTFSVAPSEGDQLVIDCNLSQRTDPTNSRSWNLYAKGSTTPKDSGTTTNDSTGTELGSTDATSAHKTNGRVNAPIRSVCGYNRWSQSALRQYLNSDGAAGTWWSPQNPWDRPSMIASTNAGFLLGYSEETRKYFKPIKVVTVSNDFDNNVEDITYDKVFVHSLEQMYYGSPFYGKEGEYWEYYKRVLGSPSIITKGQVPHPSIVKDVLDPNVQYQYYKYYGFRTAQANSAHNTWMTIDTGVVGTAGGCYALSYAPCMFISG